MNKRCLHELKTTGAEQAAGKMEMTDTSKSIGDIDLGESVLTLIEALLTFEDESEMYNIRLPQGNRAYRTVILKKHKVDIDG